MALSQPYNRLGSKEFGPFKSEKKNKKSATDNQRGEICISQCYRYLCRENARIALKITTRRADDVERRINDERALTSAAERIICNTLLTLFGVSQKRRVAQVVCLRSQSADSTGGGATPR